MEPTNQKEAGQEVTKLDQVIQIDEGKIQAHLGEVVRWFGEITRKRIRRGSSGSVRELVKAIRDCIRQYNKNARPFQWVASASRII